MIFFGQLTFYCIFTYIYLYYSMTYLSGHFKIIVYVYIIAIAILIAILFCDCCYDSCYSIVIVTVTIKSCAIRMDAYKSADLIQLRYWFKPPEIFIFSSKDCAVNCSKKYTKSHKEICNKKLWIDRRKISVTSCMIWPSCVFHIII